MAKRKIRNFFIVNYDNKNLKLTMFNVYFYYFPYCYYCRLNGNI